MSEQTCKVQIADKVMVEVSFDHTPADPDCGLGPEAEIDKVIVLNDGGYPMGDIIDMLNEECLDRLQECCFKVMGDS